MYVCVYINIYKTQFFNYSICLKRDELMFFSGAVNSGKTGSSGDFCKITGLSGFTFINNKNVSMNIMVHTIT